MPATCARCSGLRLYMRTPRSGFGLEYPAGWPGLHYYIAVPSAGGACVAIVDVTPQASAELRALLPKIINGMAGTD